MKKILKNKLRILIVEDDKAILFFLKTLLTKNNYETLETDSISGAMEIYFRQKVDIVISDLRLRNENGIELLEKLLKIDNNARCIIITAHGTIENAVEALKKGAYDYITKPIDIDRFLIILNNLKKLILVQKELEDIKNKDSITGTDSSFIGGSKSIIEIRNLVEQFKDYETNILITGETGTGKEIVAKMLHFKSKTAKYPFVSINCAAIPDTLLEVELFGAEKGAYTSAVNKMIGKFEFASKGTIFLDEISEMDIKLQAKLLRVLQEKTFTRLGGNTTIQCRAKIITAANKNLSELVDDNKFREDLYYRLNILQIHIPPLRDRKEDILELSEFFINKLNERYNKSKSISPEAYEKMLSHSWPGNVRELENTVQRSFLTADTDILNETKIKIESHSKADDGAANNLLQIKKGLRMAEYEDIIIKETLKMTDNNKRKAAKILSISGRSIYNKIKD